MEATTQIGPVFAERQRERVERAIAAVDDAVPRVDVVRAARRRALERCPRTSVKRTRETTCFLPPFPLSLWREKNVSTDH